MHFKISKSIFRKFPQLKVGIVVVKSYDNSEIEQRYIDLIRKEENNIKNNFDKSTLSEFENIGVWRKAYSSFKAKPKKYKSSVEALLRRVLDGNKIPSINNLVNIYNYISIKYALPAGADDLKKAKDNILLTYAKGDETFLEINSDKAKTPSEGEIVYKSGNDILCRRWNWRESDLTKIDENSKDIVIYIESLINDESTLKNALNELKEITKGESFILDGKNNSFNFSKMKLENSDFDEFYGEEEKEKTNKEKKKEKKKVKGGSPKQSMHWADQMARKVVKVKGNKDIYTCAAGITPSGIIHIGNFREIITVELVSRAINDLGKKSRFIYSWDDYDVFRKVPKGFPKQEELKKELRKPIVEVFDPFGEEKSFARHNQKAVEKELPKLGINPEYIYQHEQYRKCAYKEGVKKALENAPKIREILNKFRKEPLPENWLPLSLFDPDTKTDEFSDLKYLGDYKVSYKDKNKKEKEFDFSKDGRSKLLWRIDWPMRWKFEQVDFEPGGKDHSTPGGSYSTGKLISREIYNYPAPLYIMYDFITVKGTGGKISSSLGNVITVKEVLEIYEPEIIRFLFAGTRPGTEFAISFDMDVVKIYEDFDKLERIYYGKEEVPEKEKAKQSRIYELSAVDKPKKEMPLQPSLRHLTTIMQIYEFDFKKVEEFYKPKKESDKERLKARFECAKNWLEMYAPEQIKFKVVKKVEAKFNEKEKKMLNELNELLNKDLDEEELFNGFYKIIKSNNSDPKKFFGTCYKLLINKEQGPKLAPFILEIGKEKVRKLIDSL